MNTKHFLILLASILLVACGKPKANDNANTDTITNAGTTKGVVFIYDAPVNGWNVEIEYVEDTTRTDYVHNLLLYGYAHITLRNEQHIYCFNTPFEVSPDLYVDSAFELLSDKEKTERLFAQDTLILSYVDVNFNDSMRLTHKLPIEERNLIYFADFDMDGEDEILIPHKGERWLLLDEFYYLFDITSKEVLPYTNNEDLFIKSGTRMYFFPEDTAIITTYRGENFVIHKGDGDGNFYCKRCLSDTWYSDTIGIQDYNEKEVIIDSCVTANPWRWTYETYSEGSPSFGDITFEEMIHLPYQSLKARCDSILKKRDAYWFDNCLKDGIICLTTAPLRLHLQNDTLRKYSEYNLDIAYPVAAKSMEEACFDGYNETLDSIVGKECLLEMSAEALETLQKELMRVIIDYVNNERGMHYAVGGSVEKAQKAFERMFLDEIEHTIQVSITQDPYTTERWVDVRHVYVNIVDRTDEMIENDIITFGLLFREYDVIEYRTYTNWYYFSFDLKTGKQIIEDEQ